MQIFYQPSEEADRDESNGGDSTPTQYHVAVMLEGFEGAHGAERRNVLGRCSICCP